MFLLTLIKPQESYFSGALHPNSTQQWSLNQSSMINFLVSFSLQNIRILTIRRSYQDVDSLQPVEAKFNRIETIQNFSKHFLVTNTFAQTDKSTTYKYPIKNKLELEAEFNRLAEEWHEETRMLSLVTQKSMHPAYQRIIGMGQPVVPLILRDLEQKPDHWFWALRAITGANPVKSDMVGRMKLMAQAWIQWGKEHGYEW